MLENIANIASIIASISIFIAIFQLVREMRVQNLQSFFYLHGYLSQDNFSDARKCVRTILCHKEYSDWTDEDRTKANYVCASYDQTGILFSSHAIDNRTQLEFLTSSWGLSIIDQYESLAPFLDDKQTPTMTGREFFHHFTWLYEQTIAIHKGT